MSSVTFGQLVIGSPGAGKTTYCEAMSRFLQALGREVAIVNIDPANDQVPYHADVDISELIKLEEVMEHFDLGPNGGLIYCMEFLEKNVHWLLSKLKSVSKKYLLIDCPGQVELFTHNSCVRNIVNVLEKNGTRLCAVNLVDAHYCSDAAKYVAICLTSLNTMMKIELPHVNILSKVDLIEKYGRLDFGIDYYTEVLDLQYLIERMPDDPFTLKHKKLTKALTDLVQDYGLVTFMPLSIESKELMMNVRNAVDKANGYCFGSTTEERNMRSLMSSTFGATQFEYEKTQQIREKFMQNPDELRCDEDVITNDLENVDIDPEFQV